MGVGAVGSGAAPQLQTSWTRAEAACAAAHRGDTYYELTKAPPAPSTPAATTAADEDEGSTGLAPGFTLHL